ncbi:MAG TPA: MetQ/NlpA family ABC transporter substrate-binding protein [Paenalcaligenes sp.]|nr:MetQ/NlpA family ABC transporter substrate-binding protein [Paenalcaligenes sp.]
MPQSPLRRLLQFVGAVATVSLVHLSPVHAQDDVLRVGVTAGPHAQMGEVVQKVAKEKGLEVRLVEFNDFIQPNAALDAGDIDINIYQHVPFLESQNEMRGYKLVPVGNGVVQLMGVYSNRYDSIDELPEGGTIAIPNDPTNGARALLVLQAANLIKLKDGVTVTASPFDIVENPKKFRFIEIEAAQLPHSLSDVDAAAVNSAYAVQAGLSPTDDSLTLESSDAQFAVVVIAAREDNKDDPRIATYVESYRSDELKAFVEETFKGAYTTTW